MKILIISILSFTLILSIISCGENDPMNMRSDNFDRSLLLNNWADHIIVPALEAYKQSTEELVIKKNQFLLSESLEDLNHLREAYLESYVLWQSVSMFDIGKSEEIGLRNFTNIFPPDTNQIQSHIIQQEYNLSLPSTFDAQGFPAIDYLLFGSGNDVTEIYNLLTTPNYSSYLNDLITRLDSLPGVVLNDWINGYSDTFKENAGAGFSSSVDKLINDYLFYYEKYFRAGKVGLPAGVFSGTPFPNLVEAPYSKIYSKRLLIASFEAILNFFEGKSLLDGENRESIQDYLTYIKDQNNTHDIANEILDQWNKVRANIELLDDNLFSQVENDNNLMLQTYDEMQKAVVLLKVDMMQALDIQIDYVDADGD